ncbi:MAG TPA: hypothetical protein DDW17_09310 [Deltaproteobacteria bacterium]|nr:hypothetical protein [Deltaproteobacteria bacterium]
MSRLPEFPEFKHVDLEDRNIIQEILHSSYKPQTSEWTFTNLFIWRSHYNFQWSIYKDWLLVYCKEDDDIYMMQPIGPEGRNVLVDILFQWLKDEKGQAIPRIEKADKRFVSELFPSKHIIIEPSRNHFDYVYLRENLVQLSGNRYRSKRNHINHLIRAYTFTYIELQEEHLKDCLLLQEKWCEMKRCKDDLNLMGEWEAVREILTNYHILNLTGGVIMIEGRVEAFTIGELLNENTAVVHIEKANPEIPGLYPMINQQFCEKSLHNVTYVNREQDLGIDGLREAKLSYYPDHFEEKYQIRMV